MRRTLITITLFSFATWALLLAFAVSMDGQPSPPFPANLFFMLTAASSVILLSLTWGFSRPIPEPATAALLGIGIVAVWAVGRKRR